LSLDVEHVADHRHATASPSRTTRFAIVKLRHRAFLFEACHNVITASARIA